MGQEEFYKKPLSLLKKVTNWLKRLSVKQLILAFVALLFVFWVAERFVDSGTFFGYQVRSKKPSVKINSEQVETLACSKLTNEEVSGVLGAKAKRIGGAFPDKTEPNLISTCSYMLSLQPTRNVTVLIRDSATDDAAKNAINDIKKRNKVEVIDGFGDEAFFSPVARQLNVRDGKRIISVTVSKPVDGSKKSNKEAAIELFEKI